MSVFFPHFNDILKMTVRVEQVAVDFMMKDENCLIIQTRQKLHALPSALYIM